MSETGGRWHPKRLLLEILADADRQTVLAQAATVARALEVEIAGVFVEEADLFDLAALPLGSEIGSVSRRLRRLETASLTAEATRSAAAFRREFATLSEALGRSVRLEVLRGRSLDPIRQAGREDLVIYTGSTGRLEEAAFARALLEASERTAGLLLTPPRSEAASGPVIVAARSPARLEPALPALRRLAGEAEVLVETPAIGAGGGLPAAAALARHWRARLLVGEVETARPGLEEELHLALRRLRCPLLLLNPGA